MVFQTVPRELIHPVWNAARNLALGIVIFQIAKQMISWIYSNLVGPKFFGPRVDFKSLGEWAVVTGATDGIGKAYAKALAKKGINIVLISRSLDKLESVSKEIAEESHVQVKIIAVDFTGGLEIYDKIKTDIEGLDIGVLVNNVGISYEYPEYFLTYIDENTKFVSDIILANIYSVVNMTKLVLPRMVMKHKGLVINIASAAGQIPSPLLSLYAASKAFVNKFSVDLNYEYKDKGIIIQSVNPGFVATKIAKIRKSSPLAPYPESFVKSALKTVGIANQTTGYWSHAFLVLFTSTLSSVFCNALAYNVIYKQMLATRQKYLHKKKKE